MARPDDVTFEPETIELIRTVLDETVSKLPNELRTTIVKTKMAELILRFAAGGERDPSRLGTFALVHVTERHRASLRKKGMDDGAIM